MSDVCNEELDTRGLRCPEPVMMLHRKLRKMAVGETVKVIATDPATKRDIPNFCEFLPHALTKQETANPTADETEYSYWIVKGER